MLVDPQDLLRRFAIQTRELMNAFMAEGFSRAEAFELTRAHLQSGCLISDDD